MRAFGLGTDTPERVWFNGEPGSFSVLTGDQLTENLHMAFPASENQTVDDFHQAATSPATATTARPASAPSTTRATTARSY